MDRIVKFCAGSSSKLLLALLFVALMQTVGLHRVEAASPVGAVGTNLATTLNDIGTCGAYHCWTVTVDTSYFPSSCMSDFSAVSGAVYLNYSRPSGTRISGYSGSITGGGVTPTAICSTPNNGLVFGGYGGGQSFIFNSDPGFTGGETGTFYWNLTPDSTGAVNSVAYVAVNWNGSTLSLAPYSPAPLNPTGLFSANKTHFLSVDTTGTSTVKVDATYFLDEDEVDSSISNLNPTQIYFQISLRPTTSVSGRGENISNSTFGTSSVYTKFNSLADGVYDLNVKFSNLGCTFNSANCPFAGSYVYSSFTIAGGVLTATGTNEYYNPFPFSASSSVPYSECSFTELSGCFVNTALYLFYPNAASLDAFGVTYSTLATKFPFAYMVDFRESVTQIYTASTTESATITVPFGTFGNITLLSAGLISGVPYASLIRTILGALIWVMLAVQVWRRAQTIFNAKTV